jgi:lipopolysaccharide transport system ATP-binding protein
MTKQEIHSKFDEIVDFSGVERYIDTPVKRYSSGMYVRLAFAVAAHLEPEILIVDEVLAVGDAEFQKKCLGKMKDVSGQGRTVLFVSHNMPSIRLLCTQCAFMEQGTLKSIGYTDTIIGQYLSVNNMLQTENKNEIPSNYSLHGTGEARFKKAGILNSQQKQVDKLDFLETFYVEGEFEVYKDIIDCILSINIVNQYGERIMMAPENERYSPLSFQKGSYKIITEFNEKLMPGNYSIGLALSFLHTGGDIDFIESFYPFTVGKESKEKNMEYPWTTIRGYIQSQTKWKIVKQ